jgi:molecular chaperone DnaJ
MAKRCYYEVLGVERTSSDGELKTAYRRLAMECHPDRNPGDAGAEARFKELSEAYDVLKDGEKRAAYDRYGYAAFEGGRGASGAGGFDFSSSFTDVFDDLFGDLMGGRRGGGRRAARGADLRYDLVVSLEEAFRGHTAELRVPSHVACESCGGTGAEEGSTAETCTGCSGHGKVRQQNGFFTIERTCPKCRGAGKVISKPCRTCRGAGHVKKERTLQVDIPAGVEEGTRIRLQGEGHAGQAGAPPGDLYIFLSVAQHPIFQRDGSDLYCRVPISFATAALGGVIEVPTLGGGTAKIDVPEGTQTDHRFRVKAKGMPALRGSGFGDLYVEVRVETPTKLSKAQKELLRAFAENDKGAQPETEGFFAKMKDFLGGGEA